MTRLRHIFLTFLPVFLMMTGFAVSGAEPSTADSIRASVKTQMAHYPTSRLRDIYKNFMQDFYGPGHILADTAAAGRYIRHELATTTRFEGPDFEPTGFRGNFVRVNIRLILDGTIPYDTFFDSFVTSVRSITPPPPEVWMPIWQQIDNEVISLGLNLPEEASDREALEAQFARGDYIVHHSEAFNKASNFHYRIISRDNFEKNILPLINRKKSLENEPD